MRHTLWRQLRFLFIVFLGYLLHVTVMTELGISNCIHLPMVILSVIIVGYKRHKSLWAGCIYGILLETMVPGVKLLNLVFYPVCTMLLTILFTDKSAARLQYELSNRRLGRNRSVYLRTPLCAFSGMIIYEIVQVIYLYISSAELSMSFVTKAAGDVLLTTLVCIVLMWPIRRLLGFSAPLSKAMAA